MVVNITLSGFKFENNLQRITKFREPFRVLFGM
jgi:hypothetical protein